MMRYSRLIFAFGGLVLLVQGCAVSRPMSNGLVEIDKSELTNVESWQFDDLYKEVRIVPLETSELSLFAGILQTVSTDSTIIVRSRFSATTSNAGVWQFDSNGKFLRQIGTVGEGPGEYRSICNIVLKNDTLFAFDGYNGNVHLYNAESGEYLYSTPAHSYEQLISANTVLTIPDSENFLISSDVIFGENTYGIAEGNPLTGYFDRILPQKFKVSTWASYQFARPSMSHFNEKEALAILPLNDTIYTVGYSSGEVVPFAVMNMGVQAPVFADGEEFEKAKVQAMEQHYNGMMGIYASKNYLILNRISGSIVWSLEQQKGWYTLNGWRQSEDIGFPFFPINIVESRDDNTFVCVYRAEDFLEYSRTRFDKSVVKMPAAGTDNIDVESNDVLVIYKLK